MNDRNHNPNHSPSPWKTMKHVGTGISVIGFLMFFSVFVSGALSVGRFDGFSQAQARHRSIAIRGVFGMFLIISGGALHTIAAKQEGNTGNDSGPSNDGTWNFDSDEELTGPIKIRCPKCRALNDEAAKFCDQCGGEL